MAKLTSLTNGMLKSLFRGLLNRLFYGKHHYIPEDFNWTGDLSAYANSSLVITYNHVVNGNITLPSQSTLVFKGGSLTQVVNLQGNNSKIINKENLQIFDLNIAFTGTWRSTKITPQAFGGVTNSSPSVYSNGISQYLQKAVDSGFKVEVDNGYYYMDAPVNFTRSITIDFGKPVHEMIDTMAAFVYRNDHVRFYTNLDINFWNIRSHYVNLLGGVMDVRAVAPYTKAIYYTHADYQVWGGELTGMCIGTAAAVRTTGAIGKGFHFDCANATVNYGYICRIHVGISTIYIPIPCQIDDPVTSGRQGTWQTNLLITGTYDGYKKALIIPDSSRTKVDLTVQARATLTLAEQAEYYSLYVGNKITLDCYPWDLGLPAENGYYYPLRGALLMGNQVELVGKSRGMIEYGFVHGRRPASVRGVDNLSNAEFMFDRWSANSFFSWFQNALIGYVEYGGTVTVRAHSGASINFDTDFVENTQPTTANITITDGANLLSYSRSVFTANNPTRWQFGASADLDRDFIEVFLDSSVSSSLYMVIVQFLMYLYEENTRPRRIQVITANASNVYTKTEIPVAEGNFSKELYKATLNTTARKLIVRFIGSTNTTGTMYLMDIAVKNSGHRNNLVYRHELPLEFIARVSQTGTTAPVVTDGSIRKNSIGTPTFGYTAVGDYTITLAGVFTLDKFEQIDFVDYLSSGARVVITRTSDNACRMRTYDAAGNLANGILSDYLLKLSKLV